jgi:hypothetical protein
MAKSKNDEVNFHIEITVTKGEHAHVFKFECGDKHVTAAGKGLVRMGGNFEHLRKDQLSALDGVDSASGEAMMAHRKTITVTALHARLKKAIAGDRRRPRR